MEQKIRILVVDDEEFNLKILVRDLQDSGYEVVKAEEGRIACDILRNDPLFDVILLDRMMPNMDGMQVLAAIKSDTRLKHIPVIMQTAAASTKEIIEGIEAGVFYYLTKPYDLKVLLAIVRSAIFANNTARNKLDKLVTTYNGLSLLENAKFKFRTLEDATSLSEVISNICPVPEEAFIGVSALMINAIEHGNLGITFKEKTDLLLSRMWYQEITSRLNHKEFMDKEAHLHCVKTKDFLEVTIEDMGDGFNWREYLDLDPNRALLPNGRGIAMGKMISFNSLEYVGKGNKVIFKISLR